ncbi:MAG: hypothetical protein LBV34_24675, partial [Nocardiopsaceae bacterium]|nr:hypothetical protein [Nocardiopsaceae bacterium]
LGGAVTVAGKLPDRLGADLLEAARVSVSHGLNQAALGAAAAMVLAAILSAVFFRGVRPVATGACSDAQPGETQPGEAARSEIQPGQTQPARAAAITA